MRQEDRAVPPPELEDELAAYAAWQAARDQHRATRESRLELRLTALFWLAAANLLATLALWLTR